MAQTCLRIHKSEAVRIKIGGLQFLVRSDSSELILGTEDTSNVRAVLIAFGVYSILLFVIATLVG
jgi:hypothetical protein